MDFTEGGEDEVFEEFAADAAGADHEDAGLSFICQWDCAPCHRIRLATGGLGRPLAYLFDLRVERAEALFWIFIAAHCEEWRCGAGGEACERGGGGGRTGGREGEVKDGRQSGSGRWMVEWGGQSFLEKGSAALLGGASVSNHSFLSIRKAGQLR